MNMRLEGVPVSEIHVAFPARAADLTEDLLTLPVERLLEVSPYPLTIQPTNAALYEWLARLMADEIKANNAAGKPTRWVLPVGPKSNYPILARITNEERISWRNVHAFHMDEWLDWQGRPVPLDHPFSLQGYCDRYLYKQIDPDLLPPRNQVVFPSIYDIDAYSKSIDEVGGIDTCFAGFGYRGHLAFNEPPSSRWLRVTADEMAASKTRIVKLLDDTIIAHSQRTTGGYTQGIPPMALTIGMADIIRARRIWLLTDGGAWKQWILRVFLLTRERDADLPVTLLHGHPDVRVCATADSAAPITLGLGA